MATFVAESRAGRIRVLRAADGAAKPDRDEIFAAGLDRPFGIAFYPPENPHYVYVANNNSIVRFAYKPGDLKASGAPETVLPSLAEAGGGHWTRDVVFSRDGKRMFVAVGSGSNVAENIGKTPPDGWVADQPLGAACDNETGRADVVVFDPEGQGRRVFATGIRNCVTMAIEPKTGDLWCSTNERDGLGDNLPPDYLTRVHEGAFYGWPGTTSATTRTRGTRASGAISPAR